VRLGRRIEHGRHAQRRNAEAGQPQDLAAAETEPNLSVTETVKFTLLVHFFNSSKPEAPPTRSARDNPNAEGSSDGTTWWIKTRTIRRP
jgi:hypothetical protein